jgi:hypothetical protein
MFTGKLKTKLSIFQKVFLSVGLISGALALSTQFVACGNKGSDGGPGSGSGVAGIGVTHDRTHVAINHRGQAIMVLTQFKIEDSASHFNPFLPRFDLWERSHYDWSLGDVGRAVSFNLVAPLSGQRGTITAVSERPFVQPERVGMLGITYASRVINHSTLIPCANGWCGRSY